MDSCQDLNRSWRISTTPNTTKIFLIIFKLVQQSIMVILSCLAKKNLNLRKKSSVCVLKVAFSRQKRLLTSLVSNKLNYFDFDLSSRDNSE